MEEKPKLTQESSLGLDPAAKLLSNLNIVSSCLLFHINTTRRS